MTSDGEGGILAPLGRHVVILLVVLALAGMVALTISTSRWGIGTAADSTIYIQVAENLADGQGYRQLADDGSTEPMTHFPPLYPSFLSLFVLAGMTPLAGARALGIILFGANIFLVGFIVHRYTDRSVVAPVACSFLFMTSIGSINVHCLALSDSLFITLSFLGLFLLAVYIEKRAALYLLFSSIAVALCFIDRYVGASVLLTGIIVILSIHGEGLRKRIRDVAIFLAVGVAPLAAWIIRNMIVAGTSADRTLGVHPIPYYRWNTMFRTILSWVFPFSPKRFGGSIVSIPTWSKWLLVTLAGAYCVAVALYLWRRKTEGTGKTGLVRVFGIFIPVYLTVLIVSINFFDHLVPLDYRILLPVFTAALILVVYGTHRLYESLGSGERDRSYKALLVALALVITVCYSVNAGFQMAEIRKNGVGYTSRKWQQSGTIAEVKKLPEGTVIFSNETAVTYLLTARPVSPIPLIESRKTGEKNPDFESEMMKIRETLNEGNAVIAYYHSGEEKSWKPAFDKIISTLESNTPETSFKTVAKTRDGIILKRVHHVKRKPVN